MSQSIPSLDVVKLVQAASQLEEYASSFAGVNLNHVVGAFEAMLAQHTWNSSTASICSQIVDKFAGSTAPSSDALEVMSAISLARMLFSKYLTSSQSTPAYETVPLLVDLDLRIGVNGANEKFVKTSGFTVTWLQKPVNSAALKEGLIDIFQKSGYVLRLDTTANTVQVSVGAVKGLLSVDQMKSLVNSILDGKGYEYEILSTDLSAVQEADELNGPFAGLANLVD